MDLDSGLLRLSKQLDPLGPDLKNVKSEAGQRWLPLPPVIVDMLREHRRRQDEQRARADVWEDRDLIFATPTVGRSAAQYAADLAPRDRAAGVVHRGIHHLRHTYGTNLAENNVHERVAQQLLGHADSRTTREIYTHVSEKMMDDAVRAITDAVDGVIGERAAANGSRDGSLDRSGGVSSADTNDSVGG